MKKKINFIYKVTLNLFLISILLACNSEENINTKSSVDESLKNSEEEIFKINSFEAKAKESITLTAILPEQLKINNELSKENSNFKDFSDLIDNKYINDKFRYDLFKVVGHSAKLVRSTDSIKVYNVEIFNYMIDSVKPEITYPGDRGLLDEVKITKEMAFTLSFFVGNSSLEDKEIFHGTISETANVIIDEKEINIDKILRVFPTENSRKNVDLITRVTVTEFIYKKYKKREKRIKIKEFPLIKSGVTLGTDFFTETSSVKKRYKVSIDTTPIQDIINRSGKSTPNDPT